MPCANRARIAVSGRFWWLELPIEMSTPSPRRPLEDVDGLCDIGHQLYAVGAMSRRGVVSAREKGLLKGTRACVRAYMCVSEHVLAASHTELVSILCNHVYARMLFRCKAPCVRPKPVCVFLNCRCPAYSILLRAAHV